MRKLAVLTLAVVVAFTLAACGSGDDSGERTAPPPTAEIETPSESEPTPSEPEPTPPTMDDLPGHIPELEDIYVYGGDLSIDRFQVSEYLSDEPITQFALHEDKLLVFTGSGYTEALSMRIEGAVHHDSPDSDISLFQINGLYALYDDRLILIEDYRDEDYWREDGVATPVCVYDDEWIWVEIGIRQSYNTFVLYNVTTNETKDLLYDLVMTEHIPSRHFVTLLMDNGKKLAITDNIVSLLAVVDVESEKISYLPSSYSQHDGYVTWSLKVDESVFCFWVEEVKSGKLRIFSIDVFTETVEELLETYGSAISGLGRYFFYQNKGKTYFVDYYGNFRYLEGYDEPKFNRFLRRLFFSNSALLVFNDDLVTLIDDNSNAWYALDTAGLSFYDADGFASWVEGERFFMCELQADGSYLTMGFDFSLTFE